MKICTKCEQERPLEEFSNMNSSPDKKGKVCLGCRNKYRTSKGMKTIK